MPLRQSPLRRRCARLGAGACLRMALAWPLGALAVPVDTLDLPAQPSTIAARSPLLAVARAGQRLVAVGQRGHVLTSDDQGRQWQQARVPVSSDLVAVQFVGADIGWAVGHDGVILNSRDGGRSWTKRLDGRGAAQAIVNRYGSGAGAAQGPEAAAVLAEARRMLAEGPDQPFLDVWFENPQHGYVLGAFNLILMTRDGGQTWLPISERLDNPRGHHLYSMRAAGGELYIAGELGLLLRLDRGSERFVAVPTPYKGSWFGIVGGADWVLAFGLRGNAWRSADGGKSWRKVETHLSTGITGATLLDDGRVVLVSQGGQIVLGSDAAQRFERVPNQAAMPLFGVAAGGGQSLVLVGARGVHAQAIDKAGR